MIFLLLHLSLFELKTIVGIFVGLLSSFIYLILNKNLKEFVDLAIIFNSNAYSKYSIIIPALRSLVVPCLVFLYSITNYLKTKNIVLFMAVVFSLLAIYPRFGLEHLQPYVLFSVLLAAQANAFSRWLPQTIIICLLLFLLVGLTRNRYGNYFYPPELYKIGNSISKLPGNEVYLLGASDLLYPLTRKLPAGNFYLPSLPWYLNYPAFQDRLLQTLKGSSAPVIVDVLFEVDSKKIIDASPKIYEFIKMNYNLLDTQGSIEIYIKKI